MAKPSGNIKNDANNQNSSIGPTKTKMLYTRDTGKSTVKAEVYKLNGDYYYSDGKDFVKITNKDFINSLNNGKNISDYSGGNSIADIGAAVANAGAALANEIKAKAKDSGKNSGKSSGNSGGGSGGSGGYSGGSRSNDSYYQKELKKLQDKIDKLENPKVWTAQELAELYGVTDQYDYDKILDMYNKATDQYYDDAIAEQEKYNNDANYMNTTYANNLINKYLDSYAAQAPTAVGRGTLAVNALTSSLSADQTTGETATNLNNIINDYKAQRDAELAENPTNARNDYNAMGSWLLSQGANMNASDVQQYIDTLNAYATRYKGIRDAQATLANAAAQSYTSRANAALANAAYNNSMNDVKYFQYWYGDNWRNAYDSYYNNKINTQLY